MSNQCQSSQIHQLQDGHSKPQFTSHEHAGASLAMATPIPPTSPPASVVTRCAWPTHEPSIAPSARPTELVSARSRKSEQFRIQLKSYLPKRRMETGMAVAPGSASVLAKEEE